jgi:hypothetical protein
VGRLVNHSVQEQPLSFPHPLGPEFSLLHLTSWRPKYLSVLPPNDVARSNLVVGVSYQDNSAVTPGLSNYLGSNLNPAIQRDN